MYETDEDGGRIFFSNIGRSMEAEDEIVLTSVGIDIGSSTSHLAFSRIVLERLDTRYMVVERTVLHESAVLLTPYLDEESIDADALGAFISAQYKAADMTPDSVDTGALILTGVAVRRKNARAIGELFSEQTGKFVVVSAGDGLETTLAAFGSGAVARSQRQKALVLNVDIGGGTSKLALCRNGLVESITAIDVGARVVAFDDHRIITRVEDAGLHFAKMAGVNVALGAVLSPADALRLAEVMVDALMAAMVGSSTDTAVAGLYRLPPISVGMAPDVVTISGGVSEFFYEKKQAEFSDLGPLIASVLRERIAQWSPRVERPEQGIRATVVGASQYTVQVSGSTIFVEPLTTLPLRNMPVIKPDLVLGETIDNQAIAGAISNALDRLDLGDGQTAVALCYEWCGSATYGRLDAFCHGVVQGLTAVLANNNPVVLVGNSDLGGLIGMHLRQELDITRVVSIDGIMLDEFDYVDIGAILETSGAVPVVIKSLVFPQQGLGIEGLSNG